MKALGLWILLLVSAVSLQAQQTIFNVPSADVLDRGQTYLELDVTARPEDGVGTATPRIVFGIGGKIELGANLGAFSTADGNVPNFAPTFKWQVYEWKDAGVSLLVGDDLVVPLRKTSFDLGNYAYAQVAKQLRRTRLTGGVYHFTAGVVRADSAVGFQGGVEHPVSKRATLAADWYSGDHAAGFVTLGGIVKISERVSFYPAYQLGNSGVRRGNHQFLFEIGWRIR